MTLLQATGIRIRLGDNDVLAGVDLGLTPGELVGLIGPNGAGKTTLLRVLARLLDPDTGSLVYDGASVAGIDRRAFAREIAYLAQNAPLHWPITVRRLVALGRIPRLGPWTRPTDADAAAIDTALAQADIADLAERIVTTLSGGERLRTLLARALATEPRILLADEPIAALDPYHQLHVMQLLRELAGRGGAVIAVLHDLTLAARFCDRLVLLDGGAVVADGRPDAVLNPANIETVYRIDAHFGRVGDQAYVVPWTRRAPPGDEPC